MMRIATVQDWQCSAQTIFAKGLSSERDTYAAGRPPSPDLDRKKDRKPCCKTRVRRLGCETSLNGVNDGGDASDIFL